MKFIVLGCGSSGKRHIRNLLAAGHYVIAWNRGKKRLEEVLNEFKKSYSFATFNNLESILQQGADAVYVCVPNSLHIDFALRAAKRGYHLFIERPLTLDTSKVDELSRIVKEKNLALHVASNMRFDDGPQYVKSLLDEGTLKREDIRYVKVWCEDYLPFWHPDENYQEIPYADPKEGGVSLYLSHELDMALWFFGKPKKYSGNEKNTGALDIKATEVTTYNLQYEHFELDISLSYVSLECRRGIEIHTDKTVIHVNYMNNSVMTLDRKTSKKSFQKLCDNDNRRYNEMYLKQQTYFIEDVLEQKRPSFSNLSDALHQTKIIMDVKSKAAPTFSDAAYDELDSSVQCLRKASLFTDVHKQLRGSSAGRSTPTSAGSFGSWQTPK